MVTPVTPARGLLLDIGGVVLSGGVDLVRRLAAEEPRIAAVVNAFGGMGSAGDELWQQMLRREVTERAYWATRAAEFGAALGESWDTRALIDRLYHRPQAQWLNQPVIALMRQVKDAGLRLGALTNDLADFHGQEWVDEQEWLQLFDAVVDASRTGVMKPDPAAYAAGAAALDLPPDQIVYLDDMPWNVVGGEAAGLISIRVHYEDLGSAVAAARRHLELPDLATAGHA